MLDLKLTSMRTLKPNLGKLCAESMDQSVNPKVVFQHVVVGRGAFGAMAFATLDPNWRSEIKI